MEDAPAPRRRPSKVIGAAVLGVLVAVVAAVSALGGGGGDRGSGAPSAAPKAVEVQPQTRQHVRHHGGRDCPNKRNRTAPQSAPLTESEV